MLVLTRKKDERILIGEDIVVTIVEVKGDSVRIGIDAPSGVRINRAEIVEAVRAANRDAVSAADAGSKLAGMLPSTGARAAGRTPGSEDPA